MEYQEVLGTLFFAVFAIIIYCITKGNEQVKLVLEIMAMVIFCGAGISLLLKSNRRS